ncbi:SDR family NAD(P)-dependent oxidoreductase [Sphingomonas sp. OTU376]|uniref:SDR family NAD(P)-dependent oxidoreductase n=1 Tax=Sphingomonas sp. OTU376 TaxID=3043863 RepID=UPI00313C6925
MRDRVWFITGISRGLGKTLAARVLDQGDSVVGTTRSGHAPDGLPTERLDVLELDLRDGFAVASCVRQAHAIAGKLDVVVNNAGYGLLGPVEAAGPDEVREAFETNLFGALAVIQAALPFLRGQGHGHIINISSVAGFAPTAGAGIYAATKAALAALSFSLAEEVAPLGIRVTNVSPGSFRTGFLETGSVRQASRTIDDYADTAGRAVQTLLAKSRNQVGDPERAAMAIVAIADAEAPPVDLLLGSDAYARASARLDRLGAEMARWREVALSTDFAGRSAA